MRVLVGVIVAVAFALGGCASIPLSTALSLSSITPQSLAQIDPSQVRVQLSVPEGFELNIPESRLSLALTGQSGARSAAMSLSLLGVKQESRSGGLFSPDIQVSTYSLALSPDGVRALRDIQAFVLSEDLKGFNFSVQAPFAKIRPNAHEVTFWADLKLSLTEPFMPLINGAKMRFQEPSASS